MKRSSSCLFALFALYGCDRPTPVDVVVTSLERLPVEGIMVSFNGQGAQTTDASGKVAVRYRGEPGHRLTVAVHLPPHLQASSPKKTFTLTQADGKPRAIRFEVEVQRKPIVAAKTAKPEESPGYDVVVDNGCAKQEVEINGQVVGKTEEDGYFVMTLRDPPGTPVVVKAKPTDTCLEIVCAFTLPKEIQELAVEDGCAAPTRQMLARAQAVQKSEISARKVEVAEPEPIKPTRVEPVMVANRVALQPKKAVLSPEAKAKREALARELAEKRAQEKAEREAKAQALAEKRAQEKAERAERLAREKTEREAARQAAREAKAQAKAEREAKRKAEREAKAQALAEKREREREAREARAQALAEKRAREKAEREAKARERAEQKAKAREEREAKLRAQREAAAAAKAEREREKAERKARAEAAREEAARAEKEAMSRPGREVRVQCSPAGSTLLVDGKVAIRGCGRSSKAKMEPGLRKLTLQPDDSGGCPNKTSFVEIPSRGRVKRVKISTDCKLSCTTKVRKRLKSSSVNLTSNELRCLREVRHESKEFLDAKLLLAHVYQRQGRLKVAQELLSEVVGTRKGSVDPEVLARLAEVMGKSKQYESAARYADKAWGYRMKFRGTSGRRTRWQLNVLKLRGGFREQLFYRTGGKVHYDRAIEIYGQMERNAKSAAQGRMINEARAAIGRLKSQGASNLGD